MSYGALTMKIAHALHDELEPHGWRVLFDLGKQGVDSLENLGKIVSWCRGNDGKDVQLAFLDIAIVEDTTEKVFALVEIEETTDKPKVLLGDVFATLLGNQIATRKKHPLKIGEWTQLIVLAHSNTCHYQRIKFLCDQIAQMRQSLSTPNNNIGHINIDTFRTESELKQKLMCLIKDAIAKSTIENPKI